MNVLFVCRGNAGRSQIAEAIFNKKFAGIHTSKSVGTKVVDKEGNSVHGMKLKEFSGIDKVVQVLSELGIEASENTRDQLSEDMLKDFDKVVIMAEENTIPDYLKKVPDAIYWDIRDPKEEDLDTTRIIRDEISAKTDETF